LVSIRKVLRRATSSATHPRPPASPPSARGRAVRRSKAARSDDVSARNRHQPHGRGRRARAARPRSAATPASDRVKFPTPFRGVGNGGPGSGADGRGLAVPATSSGQHSPVNTQIRPPWLVPSNSARRAPKSDGTKVR
jgi:hypothetical protein